MVATATSRISVEAARSTYPFMSRAQSSVLEIYTFLVSASTIPARSTTDSLAEGDGEISFCGAIEIAGIITIKFDVIKNGQAQLGMKGGKSPLFIPGPVQPQFSPGRMLYFVGSPTRLSDLC